MRAFCDKKIASEPSEGVEKEVWSFLKVLFEEDSRRTLLTQLDFELPKPAEPEEEAAPEPAAEDPAPAADPAPPSPQVRLGRVRRDLPVVSSARRTLLHRRRLPVARLARCAR
eukprot:459982-Prorocentrum_minimum.AAC.3